MELLWGSEREKEEKNESEPHSNEDEIIASYKSSCQDSKVVDPHVTRVDTTMSGQVMDTARGEFSDTPVLKIRRMGLEDVPSPLPVVMNSNNQEDAEEKKRREEEEEKLRAEWRAQRREEKEKKGARISGGLADLVWTFYYDDVNSILGIVYYENNREATMTESSPPRVRIHATDCWAKDAHHALKLLQSFHQQKAQHHGSMYHLIASHNDLTMTGELLKLPTGAVIPFEAYEITDGDVLNFWERRKGFLKKPGEKTNFPMAMSIMVCKERRQVGMASIALIKFLEINHEEVEKVLRITGGRPQFELKYFALDHLMAIDQPSMYALGILQDEAHPDIIGSATRVRGGFSLYNFMKAYCATPGGRKMMKEWFMTPSRNLHLIRTRQQSVVAILRPRARGSIDKARQGISILKFCIDSWRELKGNKKFDNPLEWKIFFRVFRKLIEVFKYFNKFESQEMPCCAGVTEVTKRLKMGYKFLSCLIDVEKEKDAAGTYKEGALVQIKLDMDHEVDSMKRALDIESAVKGGFENRLTKDSFITDARRRGIGRIVSADTGFFCEGYYLNNLGFAVKVRAVDAPDEMPEDFKIIRYTEDGEGAYYKPKQCDLLDQRMGKLFADIRSRELRLLNQAVAMVAKYFDSCLQVLSRIFDTFDCCSAFAYVALSYGWHRPHFCKERCIRIKHGTHPLLEHLMALGEDDDEDKIMEKVQRNKGGDEKTASQERGACDNVNLRKKDETKVPETFVDNDCLLGGPWPPLSIITGPNYSGKSVYLKQIGLIVFLAHIGSYVPARECVLGLVDQLFTRVRTIESAAVQLSGFQIDVEQMSRILCSATPESLILMDEFGKGTRPDDGCSLLSACVNTLAERNNSPRTVLTTHFPEIFTHRMFGKTTKVKGYFMGIQTNGTSEETGVRSLEYLYKIRAGVCTRSFGIECASMAHMPGDVLKRAVEIFIALKSRKGIPRQSVKILKSMYILDESEELLAKEIMHALRAVSFFENDGKHEDQVHLFYGYMKKLRNMAHDEMLEE